jgi:hypothetical protein
MNAPEPHAARNLWADLDLKILDLLRENAYGAEHLFEQLPDEDGWAGSDVVRSRLEELASSGFVRPSAGSPTDEKGGVPVVAEEAERSEAERSWEITEEGRAFVESEAGLARAPYERDIGGGEDGGGLDADFWVLVVIAVVTGACAAYSLLTATGVLGGS